MAELAYKKERLAIARLLVTTFRQYGIVLWPRMPLLETVELNFVYLIVLIGHAEHRPMTVSMISRGTGLSRASVTRRLQMLIKHGYVERRGNHYCVGSSLYNPNVVRVLKRVAHAIDVTAKELANLNTGA